MQVKKLAFATICFLTVSLTTAFSGDFMVVSATLRAVPENYEGPCPTTIQFEGNITVNGPGRVDYRFRRSDGAASPIYTLRFQREGSQSVTHTWSIGGTSLPRFSEWVSIKILAPNEMESASAHFRGGCSQTPSGTAGRFRVTINGFACHRPTFDDARQTDGVDDEIFVQADMQLYDISGHTSGVRSAVSAVIGDTNGFPSRVRGGSGHSIFGGNGGFHENDTFPAGGRPWERHSDPARDRPPLLVWEGELRQSQNALLIIPSIWEWDGDVSLEANRYIAALASVWRSREIRERILRAISTRATGDARFTVGGPAFRRLFDEVRVSKRFPGDPKNRPIGMTEGGGDYYVFNPQGLVLTYDEASRVAARNIEGHGTGVFALEFRDHDELRGVYGLYLQVERLP
jgi:hypothetical protein